MTIYEDFDILKHVGYMVSESECDDKIGSGKLQELPGHFLGSSQEVPRKYTVVAHPCSKHKLRSGGWFEIRTLTSTGLTPLLPKVFQTV